MLIILIYLLKYILLGCLFTCGSMLFSQCMLLDTCFIMSDEDGENDYWNLYKIAFRETLRFKWYVYQIPLAVIGPAIYLSQEIDLELGAVIFVGLAILTLIGPIMVSESIVLRVKKRYDKQ